MLNSKKQRNDLLRADENFETNGQAICRYKYKERRFAPNDGHDVVGEKKQFGSAFQKTQKKKKLYSLLR